MQERVDELNSKIKVIENKIKILKEQKQSFLSRLTKARNEKKIAIMTKVRTIDILLSYEYRSHKGIMRELNSLGAIK